MCSGGGGHFKTGEYQRRKIRYMCLHSLSRNYPLTPKIRLIILPSSCYTFPCKQVTRIWFSPFKLSHISLQTSYKNFLLDQDNFNLISLNILIICLLSFLRLKELCGNSLQYQVNTAFQR